MAPAKSKKKNHSDPGQTHDPCRVTDPRGMYDFFNRDCIEGCRQYIEDRSIDLIITDPPYGIDGDTLHKHYNRKENFVIDGYIEVPKERYAEFSRAWIGEAERILRPGGSLYVVSGYTHLLDILTALRNTSLIEINHLIWKYNFGVYTKQKYISSHYHLLYYVKPGGRPTFNTFCRYGPNERNGDNGSLNYTDREDVWIINREYKPGQTKNKNELPTQLLAKLMQYSSNEGDLVCDLFLGGFSTARIALGLNRRVVGFELSKSAFQHQVKRIESVPIGGLLEEQRAPDLSRAKNQGKPWTDKDLKSLAKKYDELRAKSLTKKKIVELLGEEYGRGRFSIMKALEKIESDGHPWKRPKKKRGEQLEMF